MLKQRYVHWLALLFMVLLLWLLWPKQQLLPISRQAIPSDEVTKPRIRTDTRIGEKDKFNDSKKIREGRPTRVKPTTDSVIQRIDRLINHPSLSNREVAEQLLLIAKDQGVSENMRAEALGHGVILELAVFAGMAADTQLPEEMAENLLTHVINENANPSLQIRAYKDFMNHSSPEIREEAKRLLAFILEDDAGEADQATLIQMADAKLKQIEAEKPPEE